MLKKSFLNILLIILISWIPLYKRAHAACWPCTVEQKGSCTDVNISYEELPKYSAPAHWTADMWYTPCGAKNESGVAFYAGDWHNNDCCVQRGTRVRIGQMGGADSFVDQVVTGPEFSAICYTYDKDGDRSNNCVDANNFPPRCTNLTVTYKSGSSLTDSMNYLPCWTSTEKRITLRGEPPYFPNTFSITSGSSVQIGPLLSTTNYIDEKMSDPEVTVRCYGDTRANGGCCVVGRPGCPVENESGPQ